MERIMKNLPIYALITILAFSLIAHLVFLVKHPGSNFVKVPTEELQRQVEQGTLSEYDARLKEHTWLYGSRDGFLYSKMANQLMEHNVYGYDTNYTDEIIHNAFVTPGHPLYLVSVFTVANLFNVEQMTLVKIMNLVLSLATILLIYFITAKIFKNRWMGVAASLFYATYFPPLHYFRTALTEIPGIFFYCLAFYLFLLAYETNKKWLHFLFAVVFCYGLMIRPVLAPLVLFAFLIVIWKYRREYKEWLTIAVIWAFGAIVVIGPWVVRNYVAFNEFILFSTHSANSWYAGSNPFNIYSFSDYYLEREALGMDGKEYAFMKIREGFQQEFGLWLAWFTVGKTYELFKLPDGIYNYQHWSVSYFKLQHQILVILALITAFIVRRKEALSVAFILLTYIAISNLFLTIPRYGYYIIPVMCVLNGYAIVTLFVKGQETYYLMKENISKRQAS